MHRVCFVAPLARPILEPNFACDFGGAEVRSVNFARGLAQDDDFDVSIVLRSYRSEPPRRIGNLTTYFETIAPPLPRTKDLPRDAFFVWNMLRIKLEKLRRSIIKRRNRSSSDDQFKRLNQLLSPIPADVLCCFGVNQYSADVLAAGHAANKKCLLFVAHDQDVDFTRHQGIAQAYGGDPEVYRAAINAADHVVVQTPAQQALLREGFARDAAVIRNPVNLRNHINTTTPSHDAPSFLTDRFVLDAPSAGGQYILWVGRADTFFKRADRMLHLAAKCPDVPFVAIMNKRDPKVFDELMAIVPPNVHVIEEVPYDEIEHYYAHATALLSTSAGEGFPNAFLQAAKYGTPILSLEVDPGGMISQHHCGVLSHGDMEAMTDLISQLWNCRETGYRRELAQNILGYAQTYHTDTDRFAELREVIRNMTLATERKAA